MSVSSAASGAAAPVTGRTSRETHDATVTGKELLRQAVLGRPRLFAAATVLMSMHQFGEALIPVAIGKVVDEAVAGRGDVTDGLGGLLTWIAVLAVLFAVLSNSYRLGARKLAAVAEWSAHDLRMRLTERVLDARGGAEEGRLPGALTSIATSDAQRVGAVATAVAMAFAQITAVLVSAVALLRVSLPLGLLVLVGAPAMLWLTHLLGRPLETRSEAEQEEAAAASGVAADLVAGLRVLKGIGAEQVAVERYRVPSRRALDATVRAARARGAYEGAVLLMTGIFLAVIAVAGGKLALDGDISIGDLTAAIGLAQFLLSPLSVSAWIGAELAAGRASAGRVAQVLSSPELVGTGSAEPTGGPNASIGVELRAVRSGTLDGLDLTVEPGEIVGVVARDPADAAVLLRVLGREIDPDAGTARLGGVLCSDLHPEQVRARVLVAAHDAGLFGGPLLENIENDVGSDHFTGRVLAASAADEVIAGLPAGRATILTERGGNLSGGQRQRVALARALNLDAPVLVLHDPTTAVDSVTEARIAAGIRDLRHGRTTVLVTTSPALLAVTDRVVLLLDGRATAEGRHPDLVRADPDYRSAVLS
ncbi:ABC transporter ATP-binding protein [Kineosporia sp. J2-2]|uniref:ABC transporter ATP-binding protein n=1 Tax=Kineosporia corallincola TaxID=2835133 RepID=A0ABS5TQF7_9ACTN|nr:ABC transporter ATP-binding protein [Kineosporia corallincola]MBT0772273.1 ABC transporter ATP-binding protein [Kineosporia corallincola]